MGSLRGLIAKWISLAAVLFAAATAHAVCTGPPGLVANLKAHPTADNAILLGSWFASHKQFECAVDTFRQAIKIHPLSAQLHYLEGLALIGDAKNAEAIPPIQESIRLAPTIIDPHLLLARLDDDAGKHAEAEEQWKQALAIDPKSEQALEGLSADLLGYKDYIGVIGLLRPAPRTEALAINLSRAYGFLNSPAEATQVLMEAMQASPHSLPLAIAVSDALANLHRYDDAIKLMTQMVQENPGNEEAEFRLFRLLALSSNNDQAELLGPKLLAKHPHDPELLYLNGIVERALGQYQLAKAHLEEAVALNPNSYNPRHGLGMVLTFLHEWPEAKEQLEKAIALGDPYPDVHYELAKALHNLGENERAQQESELFLRMKKTDQDRHESVSAVQGDVDLAAGKIQEAIADYRQASAGVPDNALYKFKLALALHQAGDLEGERAQLQEALQLNPDLASAQKQLGTLLARGGDADGAIEHLQRAVKAAPTWVEAWINLAAELAVTGRFDEARQALTTALRLDPGNPQATKLSDQIAHDPRAQQAQP